ncbi:MULTISPECIES: YciI family protein [unclassified Microcoleus]|uniref:YciI family protein n=1 Tax=unclassified Microcoleus TaxID=2642155 RepID=UPI002FD5DEAB
MAKLFAVVVANIPEYYDYKIAHPEHDQNQVAWFREQQEKGILLCCGPFSPHDGTGLWVIQAESVEEAQTIVNSSPRARDCMLAESTRVVEWQVHIGRERFEKSK